MIIQWMINGWSIVVFTWNWVSKENNNQLIRDKTKHQNICVGVCNFWGANSKHMSLYWKCVLLTQNIIFGLFKKNHSKNMATPWTLVNKTNVLLCEVQFPRLHLCALIAEGKNKIYENQVMHTYDICLIPWVVILGGASPKEWMIFDFDKNACLTLTENMTKKITPTRNI